MTTWVDPRDVRRRYTPRFVGGSLANAAALAGAFYFDSVLALLWALAMVACHTFEIRKFVSATHLLGELGATRERLREITGFYVDDIDTLDLFHRASW